MDEQVRKTVLFVAEPFTLAHVVRSAMLAKSLCCKGYTVYFACDNYFDSALVNLDLPINFRRVLLPARNPETVLDILNKGGCLFDYELLNTYMQNELALIRELKPDLIFGDMRPSLAVSSSISRVTYCNITNAYWTPHAQLKTLPLPCLGIPKKLGLSGIAGRFLVQTLGYIYRIVLPKIFELQGAGINKLRLEHGLPPYKDYLTGFTHGDHVLLLDMPELVPSDELLPSNHHYVGPVTWSANHPLPPWWDQIDQNKPIIYVSIGSSGDTRVINSVLSALTQLQAQVILATSGRINLPLTASNIFSTDYLPGSTICEIADLVICNGGSPSIYQALLAGKPVLAIPHNMDQLLMSEYLTKCGAGVTLRADLVTEKSVFSATKNLLSDTTFRITAAMLGERCRTYNIENRFSDLVNLLLAKEGVYERDTRMQSM